MKRIGDIVGAQALPERPEVRPGKEQLAKPEEPCPICKGRGFLALDVPPGHPNFSKVVPCRCTQARIAAERTQTLREVSNLGALQRMTFDSFQSDIGGLPEPVRFGLRMVYERSLEFAHEPMGWLVLLGDFGVGKTHLAAAIANFRIALGHPALFVVVPDLLDHLRATFAPTSNAVFDEQFEVIRQAPLLILDDLGAHNSTPWAQEKLFQILNYRYNGRLPTVITSNQRPEELDPRIASRLVDPELSQVFELLVPNVRQPQDEHGIHKLSTLALHASQTFEDFSLRTGESLEAPQHKSLRDAKTSAARFAENPSGWLVFTGTYGCGKTHLAAAIANYQVTEGRATPMFVVVPDLLDHLRATFSPSSPTTLDRLFEQIKTAPLLVLDDLGTESATPWAREKLFQLFNYRYAAGLPTVITTFNTLEELDPRLASRMKDSRRCVICQISVPSYRGSEVQQATRHKPGKPRSRDSATGV